MATVTQLRTFGEVQAKRWHQGADGAPTQTGYEKATWFSVIEHQVGSIADLARVLTAISGDPCSFIIRGRPKRSCDRNWTTRRNDHFEDAALPWSAHDFDSIECPPWLDWRAEPAAAAAYIRSLLPPEFHEAACWWSFTGSQGFAPGLRMRLVFFHDLPLTCAELKRWLSERRPDPGQAKAQWPKLYPVDPKLYQQVQQIFVAAPVLGAGIADPVPVRSGVLSGRFEAVPTPWPIVPRYGAVVVQEAAAKSAALPKEHAGSGYMYHRGRIGDEADGFHEPMLAALSAYFAQHGSKVDPVYVIADLKMAAWKAPRREGEDRKAEVASRVAELPRMAEWVRERQAESELRAQTIGAPCPVPVALPTLSLAEAEAVLTDSVAKAFDDCRRFLDVGPPVGDPPCIGIGAGIGIGKTQAAIAEIVRLVAERPRVRIAFAVPTHRTGEDIAARLNAAAGRRIAATWRGPAQPDPDRPGCMMCRVPELAARVQSATGGLWSVCGRPDRGICRHNPRKPGIAPEDACGYRQQRGSDAVVWIFPHTMLGSAPPRTLPRFDILVVDEAPWQTLLDGLDANNPVRIPLDALLRPRRIGNGANLGATYFAATIARLRNALSRSDGLLRRSVLEDADVTALDTWICANELEQLSSTITVPHGLSEEEALALIGPAIAERREARLVVQALLLLSKFLESGEAVAPETLRVERDLPEGASLRLRSRREIHTGWSRGPILYLDATVIPEIATHWLPRLEIAAGVRARETAVHRIQVYDRQNGKTALIGKLEGRAERMQHHRVRRMKRLIEFLAFVMRGRGALGGPDLVVLTYKGLKSRLMADAPANVAFANFNGVRGFDGFRGVAAVLVIGRPLPSERDVALMAAIASGRLSEEFSARYDREAMAALPMRDGTGRRVQSVQHPDALADAFRRQVLTEVEQAEGRARPVRRSPDAPLLSIILTSHPTELAVDEVLAQDDLLDSVGIVAHLAARGVVPANHDDAAKVLADDFGEEGDPSAALRKRLSDAGLSGTLKRLVSGTGPSGGEFVSNVYRDLYTQNSQTHGETAEPHPALFRTFGTFRYRRKNCRQSSVALIDIQRHSDPRAALCAAVGELASFERIAAPDWLATVQHELTYIRPGHVFRPAPSVFTAILGTDYRVADATPHLLPVAEDILSIRWRGEQVTAHFYGAPHGTPLILIRKPNASWPPGRKSAAEPRFSAADVAAVVGVPWPRVRDLMADIQAQERADTVGFERAAVEALSRYVGAERVGAAVADLKRRSAHNSREGSR